MGKWILVAVVAAIAFFFWNSGRTERNFKTVAEEINQRAPFNAAPGVRIDNAEFKNKELLMKVTLTDEQPSASSVQEEQTIFLIKKTLTTSWCDHKEIRGAINDGFTMSAVAHRADGSKLTNFSVTREECICANQKGDVCVIR